MDEHAFPPTGFAVAWLGCSLQYVQYVSNVFQKVFFSKMDKLINFKFKSMKEAAIPRWLPWPYKWSPWSCLVKIFRTKTSMILNIGSLNLGLTLCIADNPLLTLTHFSKKRSDFVFFIEKVV